ncbi:hypothetical protein AB0F91_36500 [Amycolatopsis sp. NPDC023774]|uniref:hypothetical protein n=1 Tax=Amycolatopsis sp. NPDC023774 TaxID=3155015 RepID=UPI0033DD85AC
MKRWSIAVTVVALACVVWFALQASALRPRDDDALVDQATTTQVRDQVSAAVKALFSYDYANLDRTTRAAASVLSGPAVGQYHAQFATASKRATDGELIRTTIVRSAGVRTLHGDDATLLLFLDQQTIPPGGGAPRSSVAQLAVTAHRVDGSWKITGLDPL